MSKKDNLSLEQSTLYASMVPESITITTVVGILCAFFHTLSLPIVETFSLTWSK